jgi:ferrous iron transport protein A
MMPLAFASPGETSTVKAILGKPEITCFLESLGFCTGSEVNLLSKQGGNVIVKVKDVRVAISSEMAGKIMI